MIFTNGFVAINSQSARIYYSPLGSIFNSNGKEIDSLGATVICPKSLAWVTTYADKRIKIVYPDGSMFTQFPDGFGQLFIFVFILEPVSFKML